ncbi:MAG: hypothetical protein K8T26_09505 [Lentisphaerae bacterium]|nr:hypothetical protein [Lentisphaerota bacterium]
MRSSRLPGGWILAALAGLLIALRAAGQGPLQPPSMPQPTWVSLADLHGDAESLWVPVSALTNGFGRVDWRALDVMAGGFVVTNLLVPPMLPGDMISPISISNQIASAAVSIAGLADSFGSIVSISNGWCVRWDLVDGIEADMTSLSHSADVLAGDVAELENTIAVRGQSLRAWRAAAETNRMLLRGLRRGL